MLLWDWQLHCFSAKHGQHRRGRQQILEGIGTTEDTDTTEDTIRMVRETIRIPTLIESICGASRCQDFSLRAKRDGDMHEST